MTEKDRGCKDVIGIYRDFVLFVDPRENIPPTLTKTELKYVDKKSLYAAIYHKKEIPRNYWILR